MQGYDELRHAAAWLDLSGRGTVFATGRDRARLLHNLTSNHVKQLEPGQGCYAFLLTPQGRIQSDLNIFCLADRFLLETEPETRQRVLDLIRKYIIADDVTLDDASDRLCVVSVEGPGAEAALASAGATVPDIPWSHTAWGDAMVAAVSSTGQPGFRIFAPAGQKDELIARVGAAGVVRAIPEAARTVRLENGVPRYGEDIFDTTLPQESRQMHAVHFNKGCYLGQEIVERVRARGHVNRLLMPVRIEGEEPPARGTKLHAGADEAGEITSAAYSPREAKVRALAYVRAQHAKPGTELIAAGRPAVVA